MKYLLALDAGTTSVRAMLFDFERKQFVYTAQQEVGQSFPHSGWVEQDANEIYYKSAYVLNRCIAEAGAENIAGIGLTNQRETVVCWDRNTGEPIAPAIGWQCRRTSEFCASVPQAEREIIRKKTGLPVDAYFSASKIKWILDHVPAARKLLERNTLCAGTVDSYLIFKLTGNFVTDHTNASRTMLFNIHTLDWDDELLSYFSIPRGILPEVKSSASVMGETSFGGRKIPIAGVAGDQQSALFGQACLYEGDGKITYGTGLFLLFNTGKTCADSQSGLISTVGYTLKDKTVYALEGSVFHAGSGVQWLRDGLGFISDAAETETLARSVPNAGGVTFVPAFTGLGAPHWDSEARGILSGLTRGTTKAHIVRAVLESIAYSARELIDCMQRDSGICLREIKCDGGASANDFLMQYQANVLGIGVNRPAERESTALGAVLLAAISLGMMDEAEARSVRKTQKLFRPEENRAACEEGYQAYLLAVKRALLKG